MKSMHKREGRTMNPFFIIGGKFTTTLAQSCNLMTHEQHDHTISVAKIGCSVSLDISLRNPKNFHERNNERGRSVHVYLIYTKKGQLTHIGISYMSGFRWWKLRTRTVMMTDSVHITMILAK